MMQVPYATLGQVKRALDVAETARADQQILRALDSGSRSVERLTHRRFYPLTATRYFDWPNFQHTYSWKLYLDQHEVISADSVTTGGVALAVGDYFLEPVNDGPPYQWLEINLANAAAFSGASTRQRSIAIAGTFGGCPTVDDESAALDGLINSSVTVIDVTDVVLPIDIGHTLLIDSERLIVTGQSLITTGQTLTADMASSTAVVALSVADGTALAVGEVVTVGSERMLVLTVTGNTATVKRAWDGSVLAAHLTGATVYAPRRLTVERAALGTAATAHLSGSVVSVLQVPAPVRDLAIAEALIQLQAEQSAYARAGGSGEATRPAPGVSVEDLRCRVLDQYGRARQAAI